MICDCCRKEIYSYPCGDCGFEPMPNQKCNNIIHINYIERRIDRIGRVYYFDTVSHKRIPKNIAQKLDIFNKIC